MTPVGAFVFSVDRVDSGKRLDLFIADRVPDCSRSAAAHHIRNGHIRVNGSVKKPGYRLKGGETVGGVLPDPQPLPFAPEPIPLHILYEDAQLIVVNKPPGLVVHPAPGHVSGTLVNALLHHFPAIEAVGTTFRPGIVHRLDKDTSGCLVVAKTVGAHRDLAARFKDRKIDKHYLALVYGEVAGVSGRISLPIGRDPVHRKQMSTRSARARSAETVWNVRERFHGATLLELGLKTGRTHQIRVHCAAVGHPVIRDPLYGGRRTARRTVSAPRQMLHAWRLGLIHPEDHRRLEVEAPIPNDMAQVLEGLRQQPGVPADAGCAGPPLRPGGNGVQAAFRSLL